MQKAVGVPWLLCITTRLNKDSANKDIVEKFNVVMREVVQGGELTDKIKECFSEAYECMRTIEDLNSSDNKILVNQILQICLVLWVLKSAISFKNRIELKSSFKYSVDLFKRESDMHSFVFSFEKPEEILPDVIGMIPHIADTKKDIHYENIASSAMEKLSNTLDVDFYLDEQPDELKKYADEMMDLLKNCGYDVSGYKEYMSNEYGYKCLLA